MMLQAVATTHPILVSSSAKPPEEALSENKIGRNTFVHQLVLSN